MKQNTNLPVEVLVAKHGALTETQKRELGKAVVLSKYKPSYLSRWLDKTDLSIDDAIYALQTVDDKEVQLGTISLFLDSGYSLSQFRELVDYKKSMELDIGISFKKMFSGINSPDLSDFISYENLLFLDIQTGSTHDPNVIYGAIHEICEMLEGYNMPYGVGELIHRIADVYASKDVSLHTATYMALNKLPCAPVDD